ncbi:helix-hairpin-helix domain-containing protein [Haloarchaeobius sp. DT45]|uniref:helix-hairpin-helix domain-containing protein n=1 Tax=Haloarchaeobius sp. DT45 TaxID=3446116 RepID=UPI003F6CF2B1
MKAITKSGVSVPCENFKAIDEGVLLFADEKKKQLVGFVPYEDLQFVLPDDVADDLDAGASEPEPVAEPLTDAEIAWSEATGEAIGVDIEHGAVATPESAGETATAEGAESEIDRVRAISELTAIHGLGPTYADRLRSAGIESLRGLAMSTPERIASVVDISKSRASIWVDRAQEMVQTEQEEQENQSEREKQSAEQQMTEQSVEDPSVAHPPDSSTWT